MFQPVARRLLCRSGIGSSLYYAFFSPAFRREHAAFQAGLRRYFSELHDPSSGMALLRRNVHRLEKGLLMKPRRDVFAKEYIGETVECFAKCYVQRSPQSKDELQWARDVLHCYFGIVGNHPAIDLAREKFDQLDIGDEAPTMVPYQRDLSVATGVTYDDLLRLSMRRRSVRWFLDKPVDRQLIENALAVATQSPSACNRQPFVFRIFDDPDWVRKVAKIPMGAGGYHQNIPVMIVIVGQQRNYFDERDRHLIYIDGALAAMSFILAAEVQGLSTCCINWPDMEDKEREMADLIGLDPDERPVLCVALGYPDPTGMVAYSQKKSHRNLRRYN